MNILCISTLPPHPGGSAVSNALLSAGFAAYGHRVRVLSPVTAETIPDATAFADRHPRLEITRFEVPYFEIAPNFAATTEYRRVEGDRIRTLLPAMIAAERPDLLFMGRETFAWHVPDIARAHGIPSVLRLAGSATWGILGGTLPAPEAEALLASYRKADALISPAHHLAESIARYDVPPVRTIWNPVDLRRFHPRAKNPDLMRRLGIEDRHLVVAHISNLKSMKRPFDILDAAHALREVEVPLRFLIVGDGPCRGELESRCRREGLTSLVQFVGWIDPEDVSEYLNLADLVAQPSVSEAQSRVYLETQASGRVLLASDIPAAREVIEDGTTGVLFRLGDGLDLAAKIDSLIRAPERRRTIGRNARARVEAHAVPTVVQAYLAALVAVVSSPR